MALCISTGFVVDDAIVVIENITRYSRRAWRRSRRRCEGAQEIGFTVLTISVSLVAVFIPLLLMGGIVGRLFREFAVTLSVGHSGFAWWSRSPPRPRCARICCRQHGTTAGSTGPPNALSMGGEVYGRTLAVVLRFPATTLAVLLATIALNVYLYIHVPKGFFPQQDNGRMMGSIHCRSGHFLPGHGQDSAADDRNHQG